MRFTIVLFIALLLISACSNWKEEPAISRVIFINALPGNNEASLLFDGQPLTSEPLPYGGFTNAYQNLRAGKRNISVAVGAGTYEPKSKVIYVPEFKNFTAYLTQDTSKNSTNDAFFFYEDVLTKPALGKANVRFINLYPDKAARLDLLISGRTDALFTNQKFGNITAFVATDTTSTYVFRLRNNGVLVPGLSDTLSLSRQINYTILVTNDSLSNVRGEKKPRLQRITHQ